MRIRNESESVKRWILGQKKENGVLYEYKYGKSEEHLVVGYSDGRAVKDAHNRERGIIRLRKIYASGFLTKDKLTRWGYSKFFEISY